MNTFYEPTEFADVDHEINFDNADLNDDLIAYSLLTEQEGPQVNAVTSNDNLEDNGVSNQSIKESNDEPEEKKTTGRKRKSKGKQPKATKKAASNGDTKNSTPAKKPSKRNKNKDVEENVGAVSLLFFLLKVYIMLTSFLDANKYNITAKCIISSLCWNE